MYQVTFYDSEHGDIADVHVAERFDNGVEAVLNRVGLSAAYEVETQQEEGGFFSLRVKEGDIVIASVERTDILLGATDTGEVIDACNELQAGNGAMLTRLFRPGN